MHAACHARRGFGLRDTLAKMEVKILSYTLSDVKAEALVHMVA